jgi:hypothetical protein
LCQPERLTVNSLVYAEGELLVLQERISFWSQSVSIHAGVLEAILA